MQILYNKVSVKSYKINNKFPTSKFISKSINYFAGAINNNYLLDAIVEYTHIVFRESEQITEKSRRKHHPLLL
jgi:hypothetical protein